MTFLASPSPVIVSDPARSPGAPVGRSIPRDVRNERVPSARPAIDRQEKKLEASA